MTKLLSTAVAIAVTVAFAGSAAAQQCNRPKPEASLPTQTIASPTQIAAVTQAQQPASR